MLALLILLLGWCWWTMRIENFDAAEQDKISEIDAKLSRHDVSLNLIQTGITGMQEQLDVTSAISLYNFLLAAPYINEEGDGYNFPKGDTGARGLRGARGHTGIKGDKGDKGDRGDVGRDGSSIFDVSKYLLNGNTDLFKRKEDRKDTREPQPINAYTTLFD